jgi:hypothetical protein
MFATLVLALAVVAGDPVTGSPFYVPRLGELAVLHGYDILEDKVAPKLSAFTSAEALSKYEMDFHDALRSSQEWNSASPDARGGIANKMGVKLLTDARDQGNVIQLPDMTKVKVLARAFFNRRIEENSRKDDAAVASYSDTCFVEITEGPMRGRTVWLSIDAVRVPGSKPPSLGIKLGPKNDEADDGKPATTDQRKGSAIEDVDGDQKKPKVQILDSAWKPSRSGNFVEVSCTFRNLSGFALNGLTANIVYKDQNRRLIYSKEWFIGDVAPGEEKTFTAAHASDPRMDSYRIEFETTNGFKHAVVEVVTEDSGQSINKSQRRGKARPNR